LAQFEVAPFRA